MKASRFTEAQKAFVLKQGEEGTPVAVIDVLTDLFILRGVPGHVRSDMVEAEKQWDIVADALREKQPNLDANGRLP